MAKTTASKASTRATAKALLKKKAEEQLQSGSSSNSSTPSSNGASAQNTTTQFNEEKKSGKGIFMFVSIALLLIIVVVLFGTFYSGQVGQAIFFGSQPVIAPVNLVTEESFIFTTLPQNPVTVTFNITDDPLSFTHRTYNFTIQQKPSSTLSAAQQPTYNFTIQTSYPATTPANPNRIIVRDQVTLPNDNTVLHLTTADPIADLQVTLQNNQITVTNLHYVNAAPSAVEVFDATLAPPRTAQTPIISLQPGATFSGIINATSVTSPDITAQITVNGQTSALPLTNLQQRLVDNSTSARFSWQAPSSSTAAVLDIVATVQSQQTHAYYTFAVGNVVFAQQQQNYPALRMTSTTATTATFEATLRATTQLQPLAFPCLPTSPQVDRFLTANPEIARIYSFNNGAPVVASQNSPGDISQFNLFEGYFLELTNAQATTVSFTCNVQDLMPASLVPSPTEQTRIIAPQWNLISIPGIVPRPLTDFVGQQQFNLFSCAQNYVCTQVDPTTPLIPGRPYWIYSTSGLTMRYTLQ